MAELIDDSTGEASTSSSPLIGGGVVIDLGTGDGRFVYESARENPNKFYIGIDANPRPLEKISEKIHRKPSKGGLPNVAFVQAALEDLPSELDRVADELHVHFPWGSLLRAVAAGERSALTNLRRLCADGALLEVVISLDPDRDRMEMTRLGLPPLSLPFVDEVLVSRYREAGFEIVERGVLSESEWIDLRTSWSRRLRQSDTRVVLYVIASAV